MDYIEIDFFPIPFLIGVSTLALLLIFLRRKKRSLAYLCCLFLFGIYFLIVLNVVFFPISIPLDWPASITSQRILGTLSHINLIPLRYGRRFHISLNLLVWEVAGNILLTMPLGFLLPFLIRIPPRRIFWIALATGLALETTQLAFELLSMIGGYPHAIDINDVITNATGVLVGYGLYWLVNWLWVELKMIRPRLPSANEENK